MLGHPKSGGPRPARARAGHVHNRRMDDGGDREDADAARAAEERNWIADVARGGEQGNGAMHKLFLRYRGPFRAKLRWRGLGEADIDDVMQKVWIDVAKKAATFSPEGLPRAWLWGFVKNKVKDYFRAQDRRGARFISANDEGAASSVANALSSDPSPEAARARSDFNDCVQQAFAAFKQHHGDEAWWVYRRHVEDWDLNEIAKQQGKSPHAVSQALSMLRKALREFIAPCLELRTD